MFEIFLDFLPGGGGGGGGYSHMEGTGMLVGNFDLTPKRDQSGRGQS